MAEEESGDRGYYPRRMTGTSCLQSTPVPDLHCLQQSFGGRIELCVMGVTMGRESGLFIPYFQPEYYQLNWPIFLKGTSFTQDFTLAQSYCLLPIHPLYLLWDRNNEKSFIGSHYKINPLICIQLHILYFPSMYYGWTIFQLFGGFLS